MKIVSFEVAKAIKKVGYHEPSKYFYGDGYDDEDNPEHKFELCGAFPTFVQDWNNTDKFPIYESGSEKYRKNVISAPTYLEVWLWLWRKQNIKINYDNSIITIDFIDDTIELEDSSTDPEEGIIKAIEYLVENNLIK